MQSLMEAYQAARLRHDAGAAGMLPTGTDRDPDSVLDDSPFAWQARPCNNQRGPAPCWHTPALEYGAA